MSFLKKNNEYGEFIVILWCTKSQREQRGNGSLLPAAHKHLTVFPLTTKKQPIRLKLFLAHLSLS